MQENRRILRCCSTAAITVTVCSQTQTAKTLGQPQQTAAPPHKLVSSLAHCHWSSGGHFVGLFSRSLQPSLCSSARASRLARAQQVIACTKALVMRRVCRLEWASGGCLANWKLRTSSPLAAWSANNASELSQLANQSGFWRAEQALKKLWRSIGGAWPLRLPLDAFGVAARRE